MDRLTTVLSSFVHDPVVVFLSTSKSLVHDPWTGFFSLRSLCSLSPIVFFLFAMRAPDGRGRRAWTRKPWQQYAHKQTHMCLLDPLSIPLPFLSLHPQLTLLPLCHGCQRSVPLCFWWITLLRVLGAMEGKGRGGGGGQRRFSSRRFQ